MTKASDLWPVVTTTVNTAGIGASNNRYTTRQQTTFDAYSTPISLYNAWSSSNAVNTARSQLASVGSTTAAVCFGGYVAADSAVTESRTTGAWSAGTSLNTARSGLGGAGISSAALSYGGYVSGTASAVTETWNGSAWTNVSSPALTARGNIAGAGTQSAALSFGGWTTTMVNTTEKFNGTVWSSASGLGTARYYGAGVGVQGGAIAIGGYKSGPTESNSCEVWNGSAWSAMTSLPISHAECAASGVKSAVVVFGTSTLVALSSHYDGTTWRVMSSLATPRKRLAGCGSSTLGLAISGYTTSNSTTCELWTGPRKVDFEIVVNESVALNEPVITSSLPVTVGGLSMVSSEAIYMYGYTNAQESTDLTALGKLPADIANSRYATYTKMAWSTTGSLSTARHAHAQAGVQKANIAFCGHNGSSFLNSCEYFSGASWSSLNTYPVNAMALGGAGLANAAIGIGGGTAVSRPRNPTSSCYKFNGSGWSSLSNNPTSSCVGRPVAGFHNAAVVCGGDDGATAATYYSTTYTFNGSTWSSSGAISEAKGYHGMSGRQSAAIIACGWKGGAGSSVTELFNGSTWTTSGNHPLTTDSVSLSGQQNSCVSLGNTGGGVSTYAFNGSTWSSFTNYPTNSYYTASNLATCSTPIGAGGGAGFGQSSYTNSYLLLFSSTSSASNTVTYGLTSVPAFTGAFSVSAAVGS